MEAVGCILFQSDEFDSLLKAASANRDQRFNRLVTMMLQMYSSSGGVYTKRPLAQDTRPTFIHQPSMSVFATAIPSHLYEAMSEDMLSNGLLSRMMVIEGKSIKRHIDESDNPYLASSVPKDKPVYENIINEAMFWKELKPGGGVLNALFPRPNIVNHTVSGANLAFKYTNEYNDKYNDVIISNKNVEASVWGRAGENMNKIALIAACSRHMNTRSWR